MQMIILIVMALAVLYFGALYAAPETDKSVAERADRSGNVRIFRNLLFSIFIFFALDAAIFHSGLYETILKPDSYAGRVSHAVREEKQRESSGLKEILLVGDSRIGRGFSEEIANHTAMARGIEFVKRAVFGSSPRTWYYLLREIDPSATRYQAIVLPMQPDSWAGLVDGVRSGGVRDISTIAPLLRYSDAWSFASSFHEWNNRRRAFCACILRGSAFQADIFDLLVHPLQRLKELQREPPPPKPGQRERPGDDADLVGITVDPTTKQIKTSAEISKFQRTSVKRRLQMFSTKGLSGDRFEWTDHILKRYGSSRTAIVIIRLPRSPFGSFNKGEALEDGANKFLHGDRLIMLDEHQFEFLEKPEYFVDQVHLNTKGRRLFTERLSEELVARVASAETSRD